MLENRPEFLRRARHHLNYARELGEDIREARKNVPSEKKARLQHMKKLHYMQISRIQTLELVASYLYQE